MFAFGMISSASAIYVGKPSPKDRVRGTLKRLAFHSGP